MASQEATPAITARKLNVPEITTILKVLCPRTDFIYCESYTNDSAMRGREQVIVSPMNGREWQFLTPNESMYGMSIFQVIAKIENHGVE